VAKTKFVKMVAPELIYTRIEDSDLVEPDDNRIIEQPSGNWDRDPGRFAWVGQTHIVFEYKLVRKIAVSGYYHAAEAREE